MKLVRFLLLAVVAALLLASTSASPIIENELESLKGLLQEKKASSLAAQAKLEAAAKQTLAVEAALAAKSKALQSQKELLGRLETCLSQGPAEERFQKAREELAASQTSLMETRSKYELKQSELTRTKQHLRRARESLEEEQEALRDDREHLEKQQVLLESQARSIKDREDNLKATIEREVNARLGSQIAAVKAQAKSEAEKVLNSARTALVSEAEAISSAHKQILVETAASSIAARHQFKDLTSASLDPYAMAADASPVQQAVSLIETSSSSMAEVSAVSNTTYFDRLVAHCGNYKACDSCSSDGRCAWCSANSGSCLPLDVNANLRTGKFYGGDGLTSGKCSSESWQTSVASRLNLLTLNVFASERANSTIRFASIVQLIRKSGADVIALQEAEKWFIHGLQAHSYIKNNYHLSDYGPGQAPGGLYILSRYPISGLNYYETIQPGQVETSSRGRLLVAKLGIASHPVYVANTALDFRSAENRVSSLKFIDRIVKPLRHVFLMGDFNYDDGAVAEAKAIPPMFLDLWPALQPNKPGYTWDPRTNWFAASSDPQSRSSRVDRVFVKSNQWMARTISLVGCSVSDPLCGAQNLDAKAGATLIDANKNNPALIIGASTNIADKPVVSQEWGQKIAASSFVEMESEISARPAFQANFVPSNHYGLLAQVTQFTPRCVKGTDFAF